MPCGPSTTAATHRAPQILCRARALNVKPLHHVLLNSRSPAHQKITVGWNHGCSTDMPPPRSTHAPTGCYPVWRGHRSRFTSTQPPHQRHATLRLLCPSIGSSEYMKTSSETKLSASSNVCHTAKMWRGATAWWTMALPVAPLISRHWTNSVNGRHLPQRRPSISRVVFPRTRGRPSRTPGTATTASPCVNLIATWPPLLHHLAAGGILGHLKASSHRETVTIAALTLSSRPSNARNAASMTPYTMTLTWNRTGGGPLTCLLASARPVLCSTQTNSSSRRRV